MSSLISSASSDCVIDASWDAARDRRVSNGAFRLLSVLYWYRLGFWVRNISVELLASDLGLSVRTIGAYLAELEGHGYIKRHRRGNGMTAAYFLQSLFSKRRSSGDVDDRKKSAAPSTGPDKSERNPLSRDFVPREREGSVPCSGETEDTGQDATNPDDDPTCNRHTATNSKPEPSVIAHVTDYLADSAKPLSCRATADPELHRSAQQLARRYFMAFRDADPRSPSFERMVAGFVRDSGLDQTKVRDQLASNIQARLKTLRRGTAERLHARHEQRAFDYYYGTELSEVLGREEDEVPADS